MNPLMIYLVQSSVCLGTLYAVYWLFLQRDTFFRINRAFLLFSGVFSALMPFIPFHLLFSEPAASLAILLSPVLITPAGNLQPVAGILPWPGILMVSYLTGVAIFLARFLFQLCQMTRLLARSEVRRAGSLRVVAVDSRYAPFSFFNIVFINEERTTPSGMEAILEHERVHIRQAHTLDLLLSGLLVIVQWFNPFAWFTARELKNIHEYLADDFVIRKFMKPAEYQQMILDETMGVRMNGLVHNFNISQLKKRIVMMTQKRSGNWAAGKIALALPVIMILGLLFSGSSPVSALAGKQNSVQPKNMDVFIAAPDSGEKRMVPDKQPEYPGGHEAMMNFLAGNIKYPETAIKNNVHGKVFVSFGVEKDGSINNVKIIRGIGSGCDEEAARVVKLMPHWKPGELKRKHVATNFVLPIRFALQGDKKENPKEQIRMSPVPGTNLEKEKKSS